MKVYLYADRVKLWYLRIIGWFLGLGKVPVHCKIYWKCDSGTVYVCEMSSDSADPEEIVGKGDGYTIQIRKAQKVLGEEIVGCNLSKLIEYAKDYANCNKGFLEIEDRDWWNSPQGYGGPMYDRATCNTFVSWVLKRSCDRIPDKPLGAIGWNVEPKFPGKKVD